MADIYIDSNADSGGDGSILTPYNSLTEVNAWNSDRTGDTAYFKAGSVFNAQLGIIGSATNYSVKAYGDGDKPVFYAASVVSWTQEDALYYTAGTGKYNAIYNGEPLIWVATKGALVSNTAWFDSGNNRVYINIPENPNVADVQFANIQHAALLYDPSEVRDLVFKHGYTMALNVLLCTDNNHIISCDMMWGGSPVGTGRNNLRISGKTDAVEVIATNMKVKYCTTLGGDNNAMEIWNTTGAEFSHNLFYGSASNEFELWRNVSNSVFEKNQVFARGDRAFAGGNGTGSNHFARIFGYGLASITSGGNNGNTFKNNLLVGSSHSTAAFVVEGKNDVTKMYHNTIHGYGEDVADSAGTALVVNYSEGAGNDPTGIEFKNNLCVSTINLLSTPRFISNGIPDITALIDIDGNIYWNDADVGSNPRFRPDQTIGYVTNLATWNALSFVGTDVHANPELTSEYKIESGSAAEGIGVAGLVETDIDGYYRYGDQDAGCYQIRDIPQSTTRVNVDV